MTLRFHPDVFGFLFDPTATSYEICWREGYAMQALRELERALVPLAPISIFQTSRSQYWSSECKMYIQVLRVHFTRP